MDRAERTVLTAAWLFDGSALIPEPAVVIDGARVAAVCPAREAPRDATFVDLAGTTLLPGLVDPHVHLAFDASLDPVGALGRRSDDEVVESMITAGRDTLRGGVTTVRDLGDRDYLSLDLRGRSDLPEIVAAGPPITTPGGHCHFLGGVSDPDADAVRAAVREHADRGVDVIKVMASGGIMTPGTRQDQPQFPPGVLRALVAEAHRLGLRVAAHAHGVTAIADAVNAGADGVEHVTFWTDDGTNAPEGLIKLIAARRTVAGLTMGVAFIPEFSPSPGVVARMPAIIANSRRLYEAGAVMAAGSDAGVGRIAPHNSLRFAPDLLRKIGFDQAAALRLITSGNAAICGVADRKGKIAAGMDADILAVDGDPIADPAAIHRIRAVFARGVWVAP